MKITIHLPITIRYEPTDHEMAQAMILVVQGKLKEPYYQDRLNKIIEEAKTDALVNSSPPKDR